jgi:hypothetical protein
VYPPCDAQVRHLHRKRSWQHDHPYRHSGRGLPTRAAEGRDGGPQQAASKPTVKSPTVKSKPRP